MSIKVYGAAISPFVRKIRVVLEEKHLPYEHIHLDPLKKSETLTTLNPFGRIPILEDGNHRLADSGVINSYLEAKYPQTSLLPQTPYEKARTLWFEKFGDYELAPVATFAIFSNRVVKRFMGKPSDEEKVNEALTEKLPPLLDYLEAEIGSNEFIVADQLTIADIAIATHFVNMSLGDETIDAQRWPQVSRYINGILARPTFAEFSKQEHAIVKKFLG